MSLYFSTHFHGQDVIILPQKASTVISSATSVWVICSKPILMETLGEFQAPKTHYEKFQIFLDCYFLFL